MGTHWVGTIRNCLPFLSTWVHLLYLVKSVLLIFLFFCVFCFVCYWFPLWFSLTFIYNNLTTKWSWLWYFPAHTIKTVWNKRWHLLVFRQFPEFQAKKNSNKTITHKLLNFLKWTGWQVCLLQKHLYWLGYKSVTFWQAGHDTYYRNTYID